MPAERAVEARGLRKRYGDRDAVAGLDLHVDPGETLALLGPNGAGKTTTVGMLTTMLAPTEGQARVAGFDVVRQPYDVRRSIGVVFQGPSLELQLSARANLRFHARLYKVPKAQAEARTAELLKEAGLADRADEPVWAFSGGMRRRLEIVRALLHQPRVLFLDEPTVGIDPQARLHAQDMVARLQQREGVAVLLTTHDMHEAERLAARVAILDHGKVLVTGRPQELRGHLGEEIVVRLAARTEKVHAALQQLPDVQALRWEGVTAHLQVGKADEALPAVLEALLKQHTKLQGVDVRRPTLEDVFLARTGRGLRE